MSKQERVLVGSSNIYKFYLPARFPDYPTYEMKNCTRIDVFKVLMQSLEKDNKLILISVIENFLADAARKGQHENPENYEANFDDILSSAIQNFVDTVKEAATRLPDSTFLLVKPILRPSLNWYDLNFDEICADVKEKVAKMGLANVSEIESLSRASQFFATDEVHLTPESGRLFLDCIISSAEMHYNAGPLVDITTDDEDEVGMETNAQEEPIPEKKKEEKKSTFIPIALQSPQNLGSRLDMVEKGLKKLENEFKIKSWKDSLMTAKLREDLDFMTNVKNEDRVILTGLTSTTPPPQNKDEKVLWIRNIASEFIKTIDQESSEKIIFVKQGRSNDKDIPMAEVRFETRDIATKVRKLFVEKRKGGHDFGRIYMANSVTLATRVRVDIMKSIAKQFGGRDDLEMFVSAFTSRPILRIRNVKSQKSGILTFTDSIGRFGKKLNLDNLEEAYRRAGRAFFSQMEQNFVVLSDARRVPGLAHQDSQVAPSKKRPMENQQQLMFSRNKGPRVERGARGGRGGGGRGAFKFTGGAMAGSSNQSTPKN